MQSSFENKIDNIEKVSFISDVIVTGLGTILYYNENKPSLLTLFEKVFTALGFNVIKGVVFICFSGWSIEIWCIIHIIRIYNWLYFF